MPQGFNMMQIPSSSMMHASQHRMCTHNRCDAFSFVNADRIVCRSSRRVHGIVGEASSGRTYPSMVTERCSLANTKDMGRRSFLDTACKTAFGMCVGLFLSEKDDAYAFVPPPPGYSMHVDKLDGYSFLYPSDWIPVTTSGNDVFYRNPFNAEENLFVDISSPSSSTYGSVEDFGTPEEAAKKTLEQYLEEFMSTRLGVKRSAEIEKAVKRTGSDGKIYYDIETRVTSYASTNQLAVTQGEIDDAVVLEFDRKYLTVLGAANNRLYAMRLQTGTKTFDKDPERLYKVAQSFTCKEV